MFQSLSTVHSYWMHTLFPKKFRTHGELDLPVTLAIIWIAQAVNKWIDAAVGEGKS